MNRTSLSIAALSLTAATAWGVGGCSSSSSAGSTEHDSGTSSGSSGGGSGSSSGGADAAMLGPGAAYKCTSSGKDAWDTYGQTAFVAVNESIFANVTAQIGDAGTTNLGTAFTKVGTGSPPSTADDLAAFKGNLAAFLVYAYGGPTSITYTDGKTYQGPQDMAAAHAGLGITMDQYDYFVSNIVVPALTSNGVPMSDVSSCFAPVVTNTAFVASIVGH